MIQYYAFIKNDIIENIVIFDNPTEELVNEFVQLNEMDKGVLLPEELRTTITLGAKYDGIKFIPKQPFDNWVYNESANIWESPT